MTTQQTTQLDRSKLTSLRVNAGMTDILKMIERDNLQGEEKSDITNPHNSISDTKESFEDISESIKLLNEAIIESESAINSIQQVLQSILFNQDGKIDSVGVQNVVDYATRLKNQMAGGENVQNLDKLNTLRVQFHKAFVWAKKKNYISDNERLSLKGVGKKQDEKPYTEATKPTTTASQQEAKAKAESEHLDSLDRQLNEAFEDWFLTLDDEKFKILSNQRKDFQGKFGKEAKKTTVSKPKGKGKK